MLNKYFVKNNLLKRENFRQIIKNIGWLSGDKVLRMGAGLLIGVWVARYLGPTQFGLYNYTTAYIALFSAFATLGLDTILVRDLIKHPQAHNDLMGSGFLIKITGGLFACILTGISIKYVQPNDSETQWLVRLVSVSFLFQAFDVIDYFYQSKIQSKYVVYARNGSFLILSLVKVAFIFLKFPLEAFIWTFLIEIILSAIFLIIIYHFNQDNIRYWRFNLQISKRLFLDSFPLLLSTMMIVIYMRIDQIMIGNMMGKGEVGIYSAAVKIAEIWYFIPMVIAGSVFPAILKAKSISQQLYMQRLQDLYTILTWLSIGIGVVFTLLAKFFVLNLYGQAYTEASSVLMITIWSGIATSLGIASSQFLTIENLNSISFYRTVIGSICNIVLNLILIPIYGINGAAFATLLSYNVATFGILLNKPSRNQIYLMLNAFNPYSLKK